MNRYEAFFTGLLTGAAVVAALHIWLVPLLATVEPVEPVDGVIVITRPDNVRCIGHVAATPAYVGVPPRLWLCTGEPPYYDVTGTRIPTQTLGELP